MEHLDMKARHSMLIAETEFDGEVAEAIDAAISRLGTYRSRGDPPPRAVWSNNWPILQPGALAPFYHVASCLL